MSTRISRRTFVGGSASLVAAPRPFPQARGVRPLGALSPRGQRRIVYVSDPSSIALHYLPDPTSEGDLRRWVDELADARVDTFIQESYTQG